MATRKTARLAPATAQRSTGTLRLRVRAAAESILRQGHPWLFAESIRDQNRPGEMGELAVVYDRADRFLALGLFDPSSPIRLRVLHAGKPQKIDPTFWEDKLGQSIRRRDGLFDERTTGFRWVNGESDGWPGLVLDRYGSTVVLKLYTAAWLRWLEPVVGTIRGLLQPERVVLRLSRNIQEFAASTFDKRDGQILDGPLMDKPVTFLESGLQFQADVLRGQKTGFYLDQRENRRIVESLAGGQSVLNAFSFSGGFSLYAARGGAKSVTDVDISPHALSAARANFQLNASSPFIEACSRVPVQADVFEWLAESSGRNFGVVILDPPSMAKREAERKRAIGAYTRLATLGLKHLKRGGVLVACSCSAHVSEAEFFSAIRDATTAAHPGFIELQRTGQPVDHPAQIPEARYLKAIYLRAP